MNNQDIILSSFLERARLLCCHENLLGRDLSKQGGRVGVDTVAAKVTASVVVSGVMVSGEKSGRKFGS